MSWNKYILDSSALLAVAYREVGAEKAQALIDRSVLSSVNLAECISVAVLKGVPADQALANFLYMVPTVIPFDQQIALIAGKMIAHTHPFGLSLGDRACLATALHLNLEIVTADKIWSKLDLQTKIRLIR